MNEEFGSLVGSSVWSLHRIRSRWKEWLAKMNAHQTDFSFVLGVASAVIVLCIVLTAAFAVKATWTMHHAAQLERQWRKRQRN